MLDFEYGRLITMGIMAAYMSYARKKTIDLTDPKVLQGTQNLHPFNPARQGCKSAEQRLKVSAGRQKMTNHQRRCIGHWAFEAVVVCHEGPHVSYS